MVDFADVVAQSVDVRCVVADQQERLALRPQRADQLPTAVTEALSSPLNGSPMMNTSGAFMMVCAMASSVAGVSVHVG